MPKVVLEEARYAVLGPLILQLRFESPGTLLEQSYRAEHLITLVDPAKEYPYDFICYKLTDFKPKTLSAPQLISGTKVLADLATFIAQVTRQFHLEQSKLPGPAIPVRQIAKEMAISTKTLKRWGKLGLAQRTVDIDGVYQTCILKTTWQWFMGRHEKLVARAAAFSRLTAGQRLWIVHQARTMYQAGKLSRNQIEVSLAARTHRARETIRYILNHHDADAAPDSRVFPARTKLTTDTYRQIFDMFRRGIGTEQLARIFGRSESSIYRIVHQARQDAWAQAPLEYISSPEFDLPSADQTILPGADVRLEAKPESSHLPTLTAVQERGLFRAYNYLKWKQDRMRRPLVENAKSSIATAVLDELDALGRQAEQIKSQLILANQALVVSIAKRHLSSALTLDELISEGLTPLMKAVEKFDYTRGFKFSTYASWAVMKHFARIVPLAGQHSHELIRDEELDNLMPGVNDVDEQEAYRRSLAVQTALETLDERERQIVENRFGLTRDDEPLSLAQLGQRLGVTKERVRQIETKAMDKLHTILKDNLPRPE